MVRRQASLTAVTLELKLDPVIGWNVHFCSYFRDFSQIYHLSSTDVKQGMLETIVPKRDSEAIMVVLGEQRGQVSKG